MWAGLSANRPRLTFASLFVGRFVCTYVCGVLIFLGAWDTISIWNVSILLGARERTNFTVGVSVGLWSEWMILILPFLICNQVNFPKRYSKDSWFYRERKTEVNTVPLWSKSDHGPVFVQVRFGETWSYSFYTSRALGTQQVLYFQAVLKVEPWLSPI